MPCKKELEREARIILQIMLKKPHLIKKLPLGEVALYKNKTTQLVFVRKIPQILIEYMNKNKWLKLKDGTYKHTEAGRVWVSEFIYFLDLDKQANKLRQQVDNHSPQSSIQEKTLKQVPNMALCLDDEASPILKLFNRQRNVAHRYLNEIHLQAGQKLFKLFVSANLQPHITMDWDRLKSVPQNHYMGSKDSGFSEQAYIARRQLYESLAHVGEEFSTILVEICLFGNGLEATEKAMHWPARSGKLLLTMALDRLAEYYQLNLDNKPSNKYLAWMKNDLELFVKKH